MSEKRKSNAENLRAYRQRRYNAGYRHLSTMLTPAAGRVMDALKAQCSCWGSCLKCTNEALLERVLTDYARRHKLVRLT
jgi:hypothetical protein